MATHSSFLIRKTHGQRSLVDYSPWGHKELDMTEHTSCGNETGRTWRWHQHTWWERTALCRRHLVLHTICAVNRTNLIKNLWRKYMTRSTKSLQDRYLWQCINGSHLTDHFNVKGLFIVYSMWTPGTRFPAWILLLQLPDKRTKPEPWIGKVQKKKKKTWSSYTWGNCLGISKISSFHQETLPTIKPSERTYLVSWVF